MAAKKSSVTKANNYTVPQVIGKLFIVSIAAVFILQTALQTWTLIRQMGTNAGYDSSYWIFLATWLVLPLAIFALAYLMNPRKTLLESRLLESFMLTIVGLVIWIGATSILPMVLTSIMVNNQYALYEAISSIGLLTLYAAGLYWLRRSGKWA